jgi:RNA polymerase sigma factor (TIGR02999 family)
MNEVTQILDAIGQGNPRAAAQLLPLVYDELRRLAAQKLARERPGQTLEATALVHEAYLRLVGVGAGAWENHRHFIAAAAEAMRRLLIESARRKKSRKRGGDRRREELDGERLLAPTPTVDLLALDEALARLADRHPVKSELVKLRYFGGLTLDQAAAALDLAPSTADRYWAFARAWLHREITAGAG